VLLSALYWFIVCSLCDRLQHDSKTWQLPQGVCCSFCRWAVLLCVVRVDPYVKIWLLIDGKKTEKRKTPVSERTLNPTYNELFMFRFPYERVRQASLSVSVMDKDRLGRNELIGRVVLGTKSGPTEVKHWSDMFAKTRQPVARWHVLRDFRWAVPIRTSTTLWRPLLP